MKALIVVCHPVRGSFSHALAGAVRDAWAEAGCDVEVRDLYKERFDPILTAAEARGESTRDARVAAHQAALRACDLLAIVHPNYWGGPPALMKGWVDRVFAPGAAYAFEKDADVGDVPAGLLRARAALVLNTGNTPPERERAYFGDPLERIWSEAILRYCGVASVTRRLFGVVATSDKATRRAWLEEAAALAKAAARLPAPAAPLH